MGTRRAEDRDLPAVLVRREHGVCVAHFGQGCGGDRRCVVGEHRPARQLRGGRQGIERAGINLRDILYGDRLRRFGLESLAVRTPQELVSLLAAGADGIFYPGEIEAISETRNLARGIDLPETVIRDLVAGGYVDAILP